MNWIATEPIRTVPHMSVRNAAAILWFLAGWVGAQIFVGFAGLPDDWALLGGFVTAALVWWDPSGRIWAPAERRRRAFEEVAAEVQAKAAASGLPAGGSRSA